MDLSAALCVYDVGQCEYVVGLHQLKFVCRQQHMRLNVLVDMHVADGSPSASIRRHDYGQRNYVAAAQQLAGMQAAGKIRRIGLTNFDVPRVAEMLDAGVALVSNQVRIFMVQKEAVARLLRSQSLTEASEMLRGCHASIAHPLTRRALPGCQRLSLSPYQQPGAILLGK